jgi:hypothetical protein
MKNHGKVALRVGVGLGSESGSESENGRGLGLANSNLERHGRRDWVARATVAGVAGDRATTPIVVSEDSESSEVSSGSESTGSLESIGTLMKRWYAKGAEFEQRSEQLSIRKSPPSKRRCM